MLFRVRRDNWNWEGRTYNVGEIVEISDDNPRIRPMIEQSRVIEYESGPKPENMPQGVPIGMSREEFNAVTSPEVNLLH